MPPAAFIGSSPVVSSRTSTITLLTPSVTRARDLMLAFAWSGETNDSNLTTGALPAGWSLVSRIDTATRQMAVLLARVATDSEPPSHTFSQVATGSGFPLVMGILVYRGLDAGALLVAASVLDIIASTVSFACPSLTLVTYSDLYLGFVADHASTATMTPPAAGAEHVDQQVTNDGGAHFGEFDAHFEVVGATGTQTATLSVASTGVAVAYLLKSLPPLPAPAIVPDIPGAIGLVTVGV
jgi:hypothetical protein